MLFLKSKIFYLLLIGLITQIPPNAFAQSSIGFFIGFNNSRLLGDSPEKSNYKNLMGANLGVQLDLSLNETVKLSIQPSYSQEGSKLSYKLPDELNPIDSLSIRLNYFSIPLLFKVLTPNQKFYALGGVETGLLLNSFIKNEDVKEDINADIAKFNLAMHFGVGYRIPMGSSKLFIELRYSQGVVNLTDDLDKPNFIPRVKTVGLKALAGIEIPLNKNKN